MSKLDIKFKLPSNHTGLVKYLQGINTPLFTSTYNEHIQVIYERINAQKKKITSKNARYYNIY